jgi:hypothetical protein
MTLFDIRVPDCMITPLPILLPAAPPIVSLRIVSFSMTPPMTLIPIPVSVMPLPVIFKSIILRSLTPAEGRRTPVMFVDVMTGKAPEP